MTALFKRLFAFTVNQTFNLQVPYSKYMQCEFSGVSESARLVAHFI